MRAYRLQKVNLRRAVFTVACILALFSAGRISAQVDPELLRKARAAGATQSQIDAILSQQGQEYEAGKESGNRIPIGVQGEPEAIDRRAVLRLDSLTRHLEDSVRRSMVFGREIFNNRNLSFAPNYNMPTPKNYVLAAGDEVVIEVWGASELNTKLKISPEGSINVPGVGPVLLSGYTIEEAENKIKSRLGNIISGIGTDSQVKVSLGEIRSIRVNVVGEVMAPGTYTVPSLSTLFNALYMAGGVTDIGSLRDIKVYRNSREIASFDAYDYLFNGKYEANVRLEDNDMVIVSPYDSYVNIAGKVKRPRTFEMKKGEPLSKLIEYAGGFRGDAYTDNVLVRRKTGRQYQIRTVESDDFGTFAVNDGDSVVVDSIYDLYANKLTIRGAVWRPGEYEYSPELNTLSALIEKAEGLKGNQFGSRGQLTRLQSDFTEAVIPFDVREVVGGKVEIPLQPNDEVYIPTLMEMREDYFVRVRGEVNRPDTLPYRDNMTVEDVIILSGGLKESASLAKIEVARRIKDPGSTEYSPRTAETYVFDITEDLRISPQSARFVLHPSDEVYVRRSPAYSEQQNVTVEGEVLFGGMYALTTAGERLSEVIRKAGGFTPEAYVKGASLVRKMTDDEKAKVEAKLRMSERSQGKDTITLESLDIADTYPVGIDMEKAMKHPGGPDDVVLRDGDRIFVPKINNTVKVSGAVLYANTVTYDGKRMKDYISQAGGYADRARKRPFVIYMNGKVASTRRGFFCKRYPKIEPGCEVIVPMKQINPNRLGLAEIMGLASSTTSIAAMISTLVK